MNQELSIIKPEFYHLPAEIHHLIYEYLDYEEILDLKYVCRKFYYLANQFRIKELKFSYSPNNKSKCDLDIYRLYFIKTISFNLKLTLKNLIIEQLDDNSRICLKDINQLDQLEKLDIFISIRKDDKENQLIELPNLRKLKFGYNSFYQLKINAPKLKILCGASTFKSKFRTNWDLIKFKYPSSIKWLSKKIEFNQLKGECKNLRYLELDNSNVIFNSTKLKQLLLHYPKLHSIKFNYINRNFFDCYQQIHNSDRQLLTNLQIKFHGLNLNNLNSIIRIRNQAEHLLSYNNRRELEFSNYDLLGDNLYNVREIDYDILIRSPIGQNLPSNFFIKYNNLKEIKINSKIVNQDNLMIFIKNCIKLETLSLVKSYLNQQFYDQLHLITNNLIKLELNEIDDFNLNFNFLSNLKIKILLTNLKIEFNNSNLNLDRLTSLEVIIMKINDKVLKIERINLNRYNLEICDSLFYLFSNLAISVNFNKLINWLNHFNYVIETRSKRRRLN